MMTVLADLNHSGMYLTTGLWSSDWSLRKSHTWKPPAYFSNQSNFWTLGKQYASEAANVTWGPDVNVAYSEFSTAFGGAVTSKGSFLTPLSAVQSAVLSDMKKSGFTVAAG